MPLNVFKCVSIPFNRSKSHINSQYNINGISLQFVNQVRDLGIIVSTDLSFIDHVKKLYGKSQRVLGFIKRSCQDFNDHLCIKVLYCALVRSPLEFGTVIWNPQPNAFN